MQNTQESELWVFVSSLSLHKGSYDIHVKTPGVHYDLSYQGFWLHKEQHKRLLVELALRGIEYNRYPVPQEHFPGH